MIKGIAFINKNFRYQIHATDRVSEEFGTVVVNADIEEFDAKVTIYNSGVVLLESPQRIIKFNLKDGFLSCE